MNKLIVIFPNNFTKKEFIKFDLEIFLKKNILVEVWVVNKLQKNQKFFPNMKNKKNLKIKNIKNISHLEKEIKLEKKNKTIYQIDLKFEQMNVDIFKLISKYNCTYFICPGLSYNNKKSFFKKVKKLFSFNIIYFFKIFLIKLKTIINQIIFKFNLNTFDFKKADFFLLQGKKIFRR